VRLGSILRLSTWLPLSIRRVSLRYRSPHGLPCMLNTGWSVSLLRWPCLPPLGGAGQAHRGQGPEGPSRGWCATSLLRSSPSSQKSPASRTPKRIMGLRAVFGEVSSRRIAPPPRNVATGPPDALGAPVRCFRRTVFQVRLHGLACSGPLLLSWSGCLWHTVFEVHRWVTV